MATSSRSPLAVGSGTRVSTPRAPSYQAAEPATAQVAALEIGDVQAEADGSGRLFVGESKTDQEGRGADGQKGQRLARRGRPPGRAAVSPRSKGRLRRRRSRAPAVSQCHPPYHPQPGGRCRHRGPGIRSQSPSWGRAIAGSRRGLDCRDADGGPVAVTGDAGPLCTGPVGSTGRLASATVADKGVHEVWQRNLMIRGCGLMASPMSEALRRG